MRLTQIKLSGFKSFVDPTSFHIPGQLVGVVGPNGCGKSNIIDAVRWVLGESKASELRGESMQDVIFNGSGNRKPASRASVELVFDNGGETRPAAGQWGQYAEISVKRVLTRDGTSTYSINHQTVRRRDVQDIFLGTGLGPRAYAIIGQGMISRIIEARPEELRIFLEEAAGVSKYKERRRETENRLSDTRENLTRVEDILRELDANLQKLESQAEVAQRFRDLEAERERKQKWLWVIRRNEALAEQERVAREIERAQIDLDQRIAELRHTEAQLEMRRTAHYAAGDAVHTAQGELYEANSAVNALEAEIRFVIESRNRVIAQIAALAAQRDQWLEQSEQHGFDLESAEETLAAAEERARDAAAELEQQQGNLPAIERAWQENRQRVDHVRVEVTGVEQALKIEAANQRNADRNLQNLAQRRQRVVEEKRGLAAPDEERLDALRYETEDAEARLEDLRAELAEAEDSLQDLQNARRVAVENQTRENAAAAQIDARLSAQKQLQQNVQARGKLQPWLEKHELAGLTRLWQRIQVEPGWETALEAVLRERLGALEVSQLERIKGFFNDAPPARLTFYAVQISVPLSVNVSTDAKPLLDLVRAGDAGLAALLGNWLAGVYVSENPADALAQRDRLPAGGLFVLRSGNVISAQSVSFYAPDSEQSGMLARQQEIDSLTRQQRAQQMLADESRSLATHAEAALNNANSRIAGLRSNVSNLTQSLHGKQLELQRVLQQYEQMRARSSRIEADLQELKVQEEHERGLQAESQENFERLDEQLANVQARFEDEQLAYEAAQRRLDQAREALRNLERSAQQASFDERSAATRIAELRRNMATSAEQAARVSTSLTAMQAELDGMTDISAQSGLQEALERRLSCEKRLAEVRGQLDALTAELREADEARMKIERALDPLRTRISDLQLKEQAARLNQEQFTQQLAEVQADLALLEAELATEEGKALRPGPLQAELNRLQSAIAALGAVNLAALDELTTARERKTFLDAQSADLTDAMNMLEDAIRKIDRETRALLQDTFNAVNGHFGKLFPALFGGGDAKLVMTGDEILDSGVQVMAQPPGKKNSTIHLLSGGEKALTATALVFAMFQLNPAPFCLLDEVDAPLDDANTERFCNLVKLMAAQTQFLFISHNKIAMEMAEQLIGVTMQERGVSRIVAVDMESAIGLMDAPSEKVAA